MFNVRISVIIHKIKTFIAKVISACISLTQNIKLNFDV